MAVIIRRNKPDPPPTVIKRRARPTTDNIHSENRKGQGWIYIPGFPPDRTKRAYHCIDIDGVGYAFLWEPNGRLGEEWRAGRHSYSPSVMRIHDYKGECTIVYRSPSTPSDEQRFARKGRR